MTTTQRALTAKSAYIPSLDGWRAMAILIVFISHAGLGHIIPGGLGVTIFFFLSGYLITTLMIQEHERSGTISIKNFYFRRALRLMPPLVVTLVIVYSLAYMELVHGNVSWVGFFAQLLYFANYYYLFFEAAGSVPAGTGIFWSLAVEEHFYFIFPFVFYAFFKMENGTWLNRILIATCLVTLVWRYVLIVILDSPASRTYYATDSRVDSIVFGCLLALLKNPIESLSPKLLNWKDYSILGASILALISTLIIRNGIFRETLRYSIQGIALAPLFYYSISQHNHCFFKILNNSLIRKLGQYSYSIYLIHFVVIVNLSGLQISVTMKVLTEIGLVILYASLIDIFIDKPFIRLRYAYR